MDFSKVGVFNGEQEKGKKQSCLEGEGGAAKTKVSVSFGKFQFL
jgi:hypothetical protein